MHIGQNDWPMPFYIPGVFPEENIDVCWGIVESVYITTAIWRSRRPLSQWQHSFQMKAALPLVKSWDGIILQ